MCRLASIECLLEASESVPERWRECFMPKRTGRANVSLAGPGGTSALIGRKSAQNGQQLGQFHRNI
jgi:hypothetical protein